MSPPEVSTQAADARQQSMKTGGDNVAKHEQPADQGRRSFLKLAASGAPVAAVATLAGTDSDATEATQPGSALQDTAHVRAYLASARF